MKLIINTDGASRGNPGQAASAFVIQTDNGQLIKGAKCLGIATNNEAEYRAVKLAFECLINDHSDFLPAEVELRSDSQLIARQLAGKYKVKNQNLKIIFEEIKALEKQIGQVVYKDIPREDNSITDELANLALDSR